MTNTNSSEDLSRGIERLVREHIAAIHAAARAAVEQAFESARTAPVRAARAARTAENKKRPSADIAALGERFYRAVCSKPGETMTVLAVDIGVSARELHRSVTLLRRRGRVRAIGSRHLTRYFPLNGEASA
jgi:hypothetical protein